MPLILWVFLINHQFQQANFHLMRYEPKRWTACSCCYGNVTKIHKHTNRIADFMGAPDQPSHAGSNKPTFSQITHALPET